MKQTFDLNGVEVEYKRIKYIRQVRCSDGGTYYYHVDFKNIDYLECKLYFDTREEAEQSKNELIQRWNEVLNER